MLSLLTFPKDSDLFYTDRKQLVNNYQQTAVETHRKQKRPPMATELFVD